MAKKFQVFVSSTFTDLIDERQDTIKSILDVENIPSGMEAFHAADVEQFEYIKKIIDECDYYILIIGARYGSTDSDGVSYTEREYEYAVNTGKVVLAFIHGDPLSIPLEKTDDDNILAEKLEKFRTKVSTGRLVSFWDSRESLRSTVIISLMKAISQQPAVGWVRGDTVASEDLLSQINNLRIENDDLKEKIEAISAPIQASIPDLADLSDSFTFTYRGYDRNNYHYTKTINMTWRRIFEITGPVFISPQFATAIASAVADHLKKDLGLYRSPIIDREDEVRMRIQLELLGLIKFYISNSNDAGQLSPKGLATLQELIAVRK